MTQRQQLLYLWLAEGSLDMPVVAWAFHDGTDAEGPSIPAEEPPYATGVDALKDGWFLIQSPAPPPLGPGAMQTLGYLSNEFVFERRVQLEHG